MSVSSSGLPTGEGETELDGLREADGETLAEGLREALGEILGLTDAEGLTEADGDIEAEMELEGLRLADGLILGETEALGLLEADGLTLADGEMERETLLDGDMDELGLNEDEGEIPAPPITVSLNTKTAVTSLLVLAANPNVAFTAVVAATTFSSEPPPLKPVVNVCKLL